MSTPLAVSCPHCGAGLKLKNNSFVGKKVPCPKCKKPFTVEEPPEDEFLSGVEDDYGASDEMDFEEEEEEEVAAPRSKGKSKGESKGAKGKGKGKKKSKGGGMAPIAMIAGGVVLGIGLLGGIVYGAITLFSGMGASSWVKWLPDDIDVAIQVRVADSMNAPIFKPIMDHPTLSKLINQPPVNATGEASPAAAFFQGLNLNARDIDTVTVGLIDSIQPGGNPGFQMGSRPQTPKRFVAVVKLKTALDEAKLASAPATVFAKEDYNGKSVYSVVSSVSPKVLVHMVDSTTCLIGSDAELKSAIDAKGAAPAAKRFAFADDKANFVYVAAPKDLAKLKEVGITLFRKVGNGPQIEDSNLKGVYGVSTAVTFGSDAKIEIRSSLDSSMAEAIAEQGKKQIDEQKTQLQTQMAALNGGGFNPFMPAESLKKLLGHVDTMLGSAQSVASGSTTRLTMTMSGQIIPDALAMAQPVMPMLEAMVADQQKAAEAAAAAAAKSSLGNSPLDITSYPGQVIDAGEKSKSRIESLNDQHNADIAAQMQEGGAASNPAQAAHGAPMTPTAPAGAIPENNPAQAAHGAPATPAGAIPGNNPAGAAHGAPATPAGAIPGNNPAQAAHGAPAAPAAGNEGGNDPAKMMHAAPAGNAGGNPAGNGADGAKPEEKAVPKSRSRRRT